MQLFELMITLLIASMLCVLTVPSYKKSLMQSESDVIQRQLLQAIYLARNEAIARGEHIVLCGSADQKTCSGNWQKGYLIRTSNKVLYAFRQPMNQGILHWRAFGRNQKQLDYLPSGLLMAENGTFWYTEYADISDPRIVLWSIAVSQSGRARLIQG